MSFVFFDTETTGLKRGFDQIVHFAAIRTDYDLNEIERFEVRSRLLPHIIPHPRALQTNRLSIASLLDTNVQSHYEMMCKIRRKLVSWSPAIFVGFNSIRFDEEMLRHAFFQSLQPTYLTSLLGNCRADALTLVMAADAVSPAQLIIPKDEEGRRTFRLAKLAAANDVAHDRLHDALSDVQATIGLCKLVCRRSPDLWQRFVRFSKKATVSDFIENEDGFILTEFFGGRAYHTPVVSIGSDESQPNLRICFDLREDLDRLAAFNADELRSYIARKPSPIRRLRINAAPSLTAFYDAAEHMLESEINEMLEAKARRLKSDKDLCARLISTHGSLFEPFALSPHLEERLHNTFPSRADERRMLDFHEVPWQDRVNVVHSFEDERLRLFGLRLIYCEARHVLPLDLRMSIERDLFKCLTEESRGALTIERALAETKELISDGTHDELLTDYRSYLFDRRSRVTEYRSNTLTA